MGVLVDAVSEIVDSLPRNRRRFPHGVMDPAQRFYAGVLGARAS